MNRTITMNLGGIILHIEEDAYETLNKYLNTIKGYFKSSDGRDEIMKDIELRIAEMLQEKVSTSKQAVLATDVEEVIAAMGKPEDFATEDTHAESTDNTASHEDAGKNTYAYGKRRRVFRDKDNNILGGVCAGVANYFDFDPLWMRAAFAVSFFFFGTGFLLYIILWIIIPEAKTTAEKLEMRGEKVDMHNIGKVVNEEFEEFKKKMENFGDKMKSPETKEKVKTGAQKATEFVGDVFHNMIRIVGKIVAVFLIFIGVALTVGLLATIFGRGTISVFNTPGTGIRFSLYEFSRAVIPDNIPVYLVVIALILFLGVPLLRLIYSGIRHLFGIKERNRIVNYTTSGLWLVGLVLVVYIVFEVGNDFGEDGIAKEKIELVQPSGNVTYLDLKPMQDDDADVTYTHKRRIKVGDWILFSRDENRFRLGYPTLDIKQSANDSFNIRVIKSADGYDKKEAAYRAQNIDYSVTQHDSTFTFNSYFDVKAFDKLRGQEVQIILEVPVGKEIYLNKRLEKIIYNIENVNDALDRDMVNHRWKMTKQGLECSDGGKFKRHHD